MTICAAKSLETEEIIVLHAGQRCESGANRVMLLPSGTSVDGTLRLNGTDRKQSRFRIKQTIASIGYRACAAFLLSARSPASRASKAFLRSTPQR